MKTVFILKGLSLVDTSKVTKYLESCQLNILRLCPNEESLFC